MHHLHKGANALSCDLVPYHPGFHFLLPDIHATYHIPLHASRLVSNTEPFSILCYRFIASQRVQWREGSEAIVAFCSERWHKYPGWGGGEGRGKRRRAMGDKVQMCLFQRSIIILSCLFMPPLPSPFCHPTHSLFLLYLRWTSSTFPSRCLPRRIISHCSCLTQCHLNLYRHGLNLYVLSAISSVNECRKPLPAMVGRLPLTLVF